MGTGKTAVGRELAGRLQWPFFDTDAEIVESAGKSINRIFAEDGEPAFRSLETEVLRTWTERAREPQVIATGGGIVLAEGNWPLLRALGDVVCLTAGPEEVVRRLGAAEDRPLLAGRPEEALARVREMLERRRAAYAQADAVFVTDGLTPEAVAEEILRWREKRL